jgi:RNA polymerase sigma factor (sigma-70 family)
VCRRTLGHEQDAEDAFQATFLVLARRASSIRKSQAIAGWMYRVSQRIARKAGQDMTNRRNRERRAAAPAPSEPPTEAALRELLEILHEEAARLPERNRLPFLLCCIQGKSGTEAAQQLGWKEGTVSGRLTEARKLLQQRLARRGVTLPAVLPVAFLACPTVAPALALATVKAALPFAAGESPPAGIVTAQAIALANITLRTALAAKVKTAIAILCVAGLASLGVGLAASRPPTSLPPDLVQEQALPALPHDDTDKKPNGPAVDRHGDPLPVAAIMRLGTVRFRHGQWVRSVAFAPDGKTIASASSDHTIRIWDRATGREIHCLTGHQDAVNYVAFTADGKQLISASGYDGDVRDASIRIWETSTGKELGRLLAGTPNQPMKALALSHDGNILAAGRDNLIHLVEVPGGKARGVCQAANGQVMRICFSPNGEKLAAVFDLVGVCLFDVTTRKLVWQNREQATDYYAGLMFSPDGQTLAVTTSLKQPMRLLDAATGKELRRFEDKHNAGAPLVYSQDGKRLFTSGFRKQGIIWDVATGKATGALNPPLSLPLDLKLAPDGKTLAEAGHRAVRFWDTATGNAPPQPDGAFSEIDALVLSSDGKTLLTASHFDAEFTVRSWDMSTGGQRCALESRSGGRTVALAPDGKTFAAGCYDGTPTIADAATGKVIRVCEGKPGFVESLIYTPDGKRLLGTAWTRSDSVRVWDPATGKELPGFGALPQGGGPKCMALAPDGKHLATGGMDRVIRLWDIATGKEVRQFTGQEGSIWSLAFSPDGQAIAAVTATGRFNFHANGTDATIRVWDVGTGRLLRRWDGPTEGTWSVAWSPDGRVVATGGEDHRIRLWEWASGQVRLRLAGHQGPVTALGFTPDGRRLVSGSSDTTALVWDMGTLGHPAHPAKAEQLPALWTDLSAADAPKAFTAMCALRVAPRLTVTMFKEKLRPVTAPDPKRLARLVADLDSTQFVVRDKATQELATLGELAATALRESLKEATLETRGRVERLLRNLDDLTAEQRRGVRAVEVLEQIGDQEARQLLLQLARGTPDARLTKEARSAVQRLEKSRPVNP